MASEVKVDIDPADVGFDSGRLRRIDRHFGQYVDDGLLPGYLVVVSRRGRIAHVATHGYRDVEAGIPVEPDTIWRIFSMTKPITSVVAMTFVEEGLIDLTDPISRWLPEFAQPRVYTRGSAPAPVTEPATEPIRLWHLLSHTSGLTYGFHHTHPVDAIYRAAGYEWGTPAGLDLAACTRMWAEFPLVFQPGSERDLRPTKTQQKISGRLTSEQVTQDRLDIRSYIDTARKQGINVMTALRQAILGNRGGHPAPRPSEAPTPQPTSPRPLWINYVHD